MKFIVLAVVIVGVVFAAVDDLPKHHRKFALETRPKLDRWLNEIEEEHVKQNEGGQNSIKKVKEAFDAALAHHRPRRNFHERKQNEKLRLKDKFGNAPHVSEMPAQNEASDNEHKVHVERKLNNEKHEWRTNNHRQSRAAVHEAKKEHIGDRSKHAHYPVVHANVPARTRQVVHKPVESENAELKEQKKIKINQRPKRVYSPSAEVMKEQEAAELKLKKERAEQQKKLQEKLDSLKQKWLIKREAVYKGKHSKIEDEIQPSAKDLTHHENNSKKHHTDTKIKIEEKTEPEMKADTRHKVNGHASKKALVEKPKKTETRPDEEKNKIASVLKIRKTREATSVNQDDSVKGKSPEHRRFSKKDKMLAKQKPVNKFHKKSHEARTGKVEPSARPTKKNEVESTKQAN